MSEAKAVRGLSVTMAQIAEHWVTQLARGEIRYNPSGVEWRWVSAPETSGPRFKAILNRNRQARLAKEPV